MIKKHRQEQEKKIAKALYKVGVHPSATDVLAAALFDKQVRVVRRKKKKK